MKERKRRRGFAHIVDNRISKSRCPNCTAEFDAVTAARIDGFFERQIKLKGNATMCAYCGALLIFADDAGRVRPMTEAERNSVKFGPMAEKLYAAWRAEKVRPAGDFTKTRYN